MKKQFKSIKNVINTKAQAIKELIKQSEDLSEIIKELDDSDNKKMKTSLQKIKDNISESVETLVEQTENLFKAYDKLIDEVMK